MIQGGHRRGVTLIEVMVVLALMLVIVAIGVPSLRAVLDVDQRNAARQLAQTWSMLQTEAMLRNVTFRVAFNLDRATYKIEVGDPNALVFSSPEAREQWEKEREAKLRMFSKKEIEEGKGPEDKADTRFSGLDMSGFDQEVQLPSNTFIAWAWTPQYEDAVQPSPEMPDEAEEERVVYAHVFANGSCEYTVLRLASRDDPEDGYTIEVEPLSGKVSIDAEMREIGQALSWLPDEAPSIE